MDPGAVTDAARTTQAQFLTAEALQAALASLVPGAVQTATSVLFPAAIPQQHAAASQQLQSDQLNSNKQQAKRKGVRVTTEEVSGTVPPRPPPIKHEVYEDLQEKFNQLQSEREPKRHRGNPKGYQIKSFCKNPACGKQLNGGRTNRCEHCGFDLASHRRNAQLERLIKSGPLAHTQVRSTLRDAANEVHVRTGGKAMVLTLVYIDGATPAPAQAIAYGKPAAAFVESRKELITTFEAACREHFKEQQGTGTQPQPHGQQQQHHPPAQQLAGHQLQLLQPGSLPAPSAAAAAVPGVGSAAPRPCTLGPGSQLLSAVSTVPVAAAPGALPGIAPPPGPHAVDLDSVIAATLAEPEVAMARCRDARLSGEVLVRLPQAMQLTVLMQAGLLPGEAATVVVELESRQRLMQLPVLSLAAMSQHQVAAAAVAAGMLQPQPMQQQQQQQPALQPQLQQHPPLPPPQQHQGVAGLVGGQSGALGGGTGGGITLAPGYADVSGVLPPTVGATAVISPVGGAPLLGPLQAALMAAAAVGAGAGTAAGQGPDGVLQAAVGGLGVGQLQGLLVTAHAEYDAGSVQGGPLVQQAE